MPGSETYQVRPNKQAFACGHTWESLLESQMQKTGLQEIRNLVLIISCLLLVVSTCLLSNASFCLPISQMFCLHVMCSWFGCFKRVTSTSENLEQDFVTFYTEGLSPFGHLIKICPQDSFLLYPTESTSNHKRNKFY